MKPHRYRRHLLFGLLLFAAATFYEAQAAPTNDFPTSRIPVAWSFAWDSIGKLPMGAAGAPTDGVRSGNQPSLPPDSIPSSIVAAVTTPVANVALPRAPIQRALCGNGVIEAAEACDDNNTVGGDGCTDQCVIEQSCYDPGNTFSFFTWSDSYGSAGDGGAMRLFRDAVNRTLYPNRVLPRFWVAAGDVPFVPAIEPLSIEAINGEISGNNYPFTCSAGNRTFPMFVALGNHDVDGDAAQIATKFAYWRDTIGQRVDKTLVGIQNFRFGPHNGYDERTTYSFDYKNAHFVVVNQYYGDPTYPTSNPIACVRQTVYDWIDQDLANTTRPIKFVFGHEPAWSYCSNAPGYNGCINFGNNFTEDLLDPNERPRPHSPARQAWLEAYGRHWSDSLEDAQCPAINGQEGRRAFWAMLARHKVTAHLVGHTHTYGSRLVDADGPRNDPPMTQAERNRRAYGKNGDVFTNAAGVWEVDSAMTHNSAGSAYVLVTVRNNRVTFEAWDQMGAGAEEEPFRLVESWHVDVEGAAPPTLQAGDCNSDGRVDAGDLSACAREIFDGDGNLAVNAPQGSFAGATTCDSNRDTLIAAGDLACTARLIFNSNATCTSASATAVSNSAHLSIAAGLSGAAGTQVTVPVAFNTNGAAVTSAAFTLRFDANYLAFDPTDADNNKIPDAITDQLPAGAFRSVEVGDNTINIALTDLAEQPVTLRDGPLLTVTFQVKVIVAAAPVTATVIFDNSPPPSLGSVTGGEVAITTADGAIRVQPVAPVVEFHLPLIRRR